MENILQDKTNVNYVEMLPRPFSFSICVKPQPIITADKRYFMKAARNVQ